MPIWGLQKWDHLNGCIGYGADRRGTSPARSCVAEGGGLDDAGSPVYFKKITVTPDDERAWFRKHPQWSKSNRYAELEVWIFI